MSFYPPAPDSGISYLTVDVSSAELLDMFSNPVELVAAPGSGQCISVDKVILVYIYGTIAYTQPGNTNIVMNGQNIVQFGNILNIGGDRIQQAAPTSVILSENSGLFLTNTIGNLTNGDGTVRLFVYYSILDLN